MEVLQVLAEAHLKDARQLFEEYAASLAFDLAFQNFAAELTHLPGDYAPPTGCVLLAFHNGQAAGCIALRRLADGVCEMKRLYVRPKLRGLGIGKALAEAVIVHARQRGYTTMRLDTVATMRHAQGLYESLGFTDTEPYSYNPLAGGRFMQLPL